MTGTRLSEEPRVDRQPLTASGALETARALSPAFAARAGATELLGRLPDDSMAELMDSQLLRLAQPRRWGGAELPLSAVLPVVAEIGRACGSTAWTMSVLASHYWQLALFTEQAQQDVWGSDPSAVMAGATVGGPPPERVDGGYRIKHGRWRFLSGVHHASWIALNTVVSSSAELDRPHPRFLLLPRSDVRIIEDWDAVGLAGSGSCSVELSDVFVPDYRTVSFMQIVAGTSPGSRVHPGPNYRLPLAGSWPIFLVAPALGLAQGALDSWLERTAKRTHAYTRSAAAENPLNHSLAGIAAARIDAAECLLRTSLDEITEAVQGNPDSVAELTMRNRRNFGHAASLCVQAAEELFTSAGASSLTRSSPLQRHWRDVHAVAMHAMLEASAGYAAWGRKLLGVPNAAGEF